MSLLRCCRGFLCLCFVNLCRKSMWEGAWAAAPRGIPACLGKHSCQAPSPSLPHIRTPGQVGAAPVLSPNTSAAPGTGAQGQGLGGTPSSSSMLCSAGGKSRTCCDGAELGGGYRACGVPGQQPHTLTVASAAWNVALLLLTCWQSCRAGRVGGCWGRVCPGSCFRL